MVKVSSFELGDRVVYRPNALCADVGRVAAIETEGNLIGVRFPQSAKLLWFTSEELMIPWWAGPD